MSKIEMTYFGPLAEHDEQQPPSYEETRPSLMSRYKIPFLIIVLFAIVALLCYLLFIPSKVIQCEQNLPSIDRMSRGVDITKLDLFPSRLDRSDGFAEVLFDFSCNQKRVWTHPSNENLQYNLPDQVASIKTLSSGSLTYKTSIETNIQEYKKSLALNVGFRGSPNLFGSFSASLGYADAKEQIMKLNKSISEASAHFSAYQIDLQASNKMQLSDSVLDYIYNRLPDRYEDNPEVYNEFIEKFGTHYFESANFGGLLYQKTIIENSYLFKTDSKEVLASVKASFMAKFKARASFEWNSSFVSEDFTSHSETHFYYYGGINDFSIKWSETVPKGPWLFGGKLVPIENLITDDTIRAQLEKAISVYRAKIFLADLKETLLLGNITLPQEGLNKLARIECYFYDPPEAQYDLSTVQSIGQDIDDLFGMVQEIRERVLLREYHAKYIPFWNSTIKCKSSIASWCKTSSMHDELARQRQVYDYLFSGTIWNLLNQAAPPDSKQVQKLVQEASKLMHYHESTVVDLCQGNAQCQQCLEEHANCYYSEEKDERNMFCKTPNEWRIIGYRPKKVEPCTWKYE